MFTHKIFYYFWRRWLVYQIRRGNILIHLVLPIFSLDAVDFGGSCVINAQCTPYNSYCPTNAERKVCTCYPYTIYNEKRQLCESRTGLYKYCEKTEDCTDVPNTHCNTNDNTCVCKPNFHEIFGKCEAGLGAECTQADDCQVTNSECVEVVDEKRSDEPKYCTCKKDFVHAKGECLKKGKKFIKILTD